MRQKPVGCIDYTGPRRRAGRAAATMKIVQILSRRARWPLAKGPFAVALLAAGGLFANASHGSDLFEFGGLVRETPLTFQLCAADLDQDGDEDIIEGTKLPTRYGPPPATMRWYESSGGSSPTFIRHTLPVPLPPEVTPSRYRPYVIDFEPDDDLDILGSAVWFENDGSANPAFGSRHDLAFAVNSACPIDYDGDGDTDLIAANVSPKIIALSNDGNSPPAFTATEIFEARAPISNMTLDDMNQDGRWDLVIDSAGIQWLRNDGGDPVTFTEFSVGLSDNDSNLFIVDLDQDGDTDIATYSKWYESNGADPPTFAQHVVPTPDLRAAADLDLDGDVDLITTLGWLENTGGTPPVFVDRSIPGLAVDATDPPQVSIEAIVSDLDGDGDSDLVFALDVILGDDRIVWYRNLTLPAAIRQGSKWESYE